MIRNISLLMCLALVASCYRKPMFDECICDHLLTIPIDVDWERSEVEPQNVTVMFYDSESGKLLLEHKYQQNDNEIQSYVNLPIGNYRAVIFNELRNQIDYVSCVGAENFETLKFESNDGKPLRSKAEERKYVEQPGALATATVTDIVVTGEMIAEMAQSKSDQTQTKVLSKATESAITSLLGVEPLRKDATIIINAHIKNLIYARMPALVDLVNLADGYYVFGDRNSTTPSTLQFMMSDKTLDETTPLRNGTLSTKLTAFGSFSDRHSSAGHDSKSPITLDMMFQMTDKESTEETLTMDVTDDIEYIDQENGSVLMIIDIDFAESLPEVLPEDTDRPDGSGEGGTSTGPDSGFGSDLIDWGEVDVPLLFE